eukprot:gene35306-45717_t
MATRHGISSEDKSTPISSRKVKQKSEKPPDVPDHYHILRVSAEFFLCFISLQASYLIWGIMQELIMDKKFNVTPLNPSGKFPSATFCVFSNRFFAIIVSAIFSWAYHGSLTGSVPLLSFTPCALSNTISSWCQYKALEYVGFALQTIFKSTKVIPVMLMGTVLKGTRYSTWEYAEAVLVTIGVTIFSLSKGSWAEDTATWKQAMGFSLLCIYVLSDSFTSQWQSRLYRDHGKIDSFQMMCGVNISSICLTSVALVFAGELPMVVEFLRYNPMVLLYNVITSVVSTTGQLAIYYTIKRFGPVAFTVIMITRQMFSIVLSNYIFGHSMGAQAYLGAAVVFVVLLYSAYRQIPSSPPTSTSTSPAAFTATPSSPSSSSSSLVAAEAADTDFDGIEGGNQRTILK